MKSFKGKAIYRPAGKAGEYAEWACNFYIGCSNGCIYCYLKKGVLAHAMGGDVAKLKACFKNEGHALEVFKKELLQNIEELQKSGLFFTFTSDPMLAETIELTWYAACFAIENDVPVKMLTKSTGEWVEGLTTIHKSWNDFIAIGFTLTGHDELEPNANTNAERIEAMKQLHQAGFKTFASIEPIIDFESSYRMIEQTLEFCDLYKVGLLSGGKYVKKEQDDFMFKIITLATKNNLRVYFKDSMFKKSSYVREVLPSECVTRKYNIFTNSDAIFEECISCNKQFDIEDMHSDSDDNWFCSKCWKELKPVMQVEYEELKANEEIE